MTANDQLEQRVSDLECRHDKTRGLLVEALSRNDVLSRRTTGMRYPTLRPPIDPFVGSQVGDGRPLPLQLSAEPVPVVSATGSCPEACELPSCQPQGAQGPRSDLPARQYAARRGRR